MMVRLFAALLAFAFVLASPALADTGFSDCNSKTFVLGAQLDGGFQCAELTRQTLDAGGRTVGVRSIRDLRTPADLVANYGVLTVEAAAKSLQTYSNLGFGWEFANVTLVIMDPNLPDGGVSQWKESFKGTFADAWSRVFDTDCIVRVSMRKLDNKMDVSEPLEYAKLVIAHEVFHCVEGWNFREQSAVGKAASWWVEGAAVFFASLVFDGSGDMQGQSIAFTSAITSKPLTQLPYASAYFFAWLWGKDEQKVLALLNAMPKSGGEAEQQAAVRGVLGDMLSQFARDAVDGLVKDVKGNALPAIKPVAVETYSATSGTAYVETPFVAFFHEIHIKNGTFAVTQEGENDVELLEYTKEGATWESGFFWSEPGCGKTKKYYMAGMWAGASPAQFHLKAERMPISCEQCVVAQARDSCLIGQWRITNESLADVVLSIAGQELEDVVISGTAAMRVTAEGKQIFGFNQFTIEGNPVGAGKADQFRAYLAGTIDSSWSADKGFLDLCYDSSDAAIQLVVRGAAGDPILFADLMAAIGSQRETYNYECIGRDKLVLTGGDASHLYKLVMERLADK